MRGNIFIKCCLKYSPFFLLELVLAYVLSKIMVMGNAIIAEAIDIMLSGEGVEYERFIVLFLLMTVVGFVVAFFKSITTSMFAIKVQTRYRTLVAKKIYHLHYRFFDLNGSAVVINKLNKDISEIEILLNQNIPAICTNFVMMFTYAVYVGQINIGLLVLVGVCYPFLLMFTNKIVKKVESLRKAFRQKTDIITEISQDCFNGILTLRSFGAEDYFQRKLDKAVAELVENEDKRVRISNTALLVREMLQWLPSIICAVYAYIMMQNGNISMGELVVFLMVLQKFVDAYVELPFNVIDARESIVCVKRVEEIFAQEDEPSGIEKIGVDTEVAVVFENVVFSYVNDKDVLKGISFEIKKNSKVALVGTSGGGKSTIFHLLCGFYPVKSGKYKLFGRNFSEWDVQAAREHMALVSQNVFLFPTTIRENVRYANQYASDEEIIEACKNARIHDFIVGLPDGYDSIVGERGILLSGGECQRISIARAFLKNAPILLLDEPTSAVDVETEKLISEALDKLSNNRTCIIIAHRLSTIQNADEIMVVRDGVVAEKGTHEDLLKRGGVYAGIYGKER